MSSSLDCENNLRNVAEELRNKADELEHAADVLEAIREGAGIEALIKKTAEAKQWAKAWLS